MKFALISSVGEGAQVLYNIGQEGNDVRMWVEDKGYQDSWSGFIKPLEFWSSWLTKDTIVLFDFSGFGELADRLRGQGFKVFGGSVFADKLEKDRMFGLEFMEKCGIKYPETKEFKGSEVEEAKEYVKKFDRLVFKPSGKDLPCSLTYCGQDQKDLTGFLDYVFENFNGKIEKFVLQKFIEGDIISSELYFDGYGPVYPANHTIECKKFLNDDKGPSVGCSGNLVWAEEFDDCPIIKQGIGRVAKELERQQYIGQLDLNAILSGGVVYGLEWTPRFGYDSIPTFLQLINGETGKFFADLASGQGSMDLKSDFAAGVRFSIPPYPVQAPEREEKKIRDAYPNVGIPIRGIEEKDADSLYFFEIKLDEKENLVHSSGTGVLGVSNCVAESPREAFQGAYEILDRLIIPDLQYRTDLDKVIPKMHTAIAEKEYDAA